MHHTQLRVKNGFFSTGSVVVAILACCLLLFALPRSATAENIVFFEPLTGTKITLPSVFSSDTRFVEQNGQYGKVHQWAKSPMEDNSANLQVSVEEIGAKSMSDVLKRIIFRPKDCNSYNVLDLLNIYINIDETDTSFGRKEYTRHWAWLLEDGSFLHVQLKVTGEAYRHLADETIVEFAAVASDDSLSLMTEFIAPDKDKEPFAGAWINHSTGVMLEGYGDILLNFINADGSTLAFGYNDVFWERATLWKIDARTCNIVSKGPDKLVVTKVEALNGEYERFADEGWATPKPPVYNENDLRGKWENDTEYCVLQITRVGVNVTTKSRSVSYGGYDITDDGLYIDGLDEELHIRRTPDGGLTMDGQKGVFYREGHGKGANQFAEFVPYNGSWTNNQAAISITVKDGMVGYTKGEGVGAGTASVDKEGCLVALDSRGRIDPQSGNLIFEGIEGEFIKEGGPAPAKDADKAESDCPVTIYLHADYQGVSQCLQPGSYDVAFLENGGIGNDQLSSIKVATGYMATLFEHGGFEGETMAVDSDTAYIGDAWNDRVSSIVVEKQ